MTAGRGPAAARRALDAVPVPRDDPPVAVATSRTFGMTSLLRPRLLYRSIHYPRNMSSVNYFLVNRLLSVVACAHDNQHRNAPRDAGGVCEPAEPVRARAGRRIVRRS